MQTFLENLENDSPSFSTAFFMHNFFPNLKKFKQIFLQKRQILTIKLRILTQLLPAFPSLKFPREFPRGPNSLFPRDCGNTVHCITYILFVYMPKLKVHSSFVCINIKHNKCEIFAYHNCSAAVSCCTQSTYNLLHIVLKPKWTPVKMEQQVTVCLGSTDCSLLILGNCCARF